MHGRNQDDDAVNLFFVWGMGECLIHVCVSPPGDFTKVSLF